MKRSFVFSFLLFCLVTVSAQPDWHVYVFIAEECPICNYMGKPLQQIATKYKDQASFHAVFPVRNSNYKTSQLFKEQYGLLDFETLLDKNQSISKKLGARVTPEVVITDADGEIQYRGRINSAYYAPGKMKHSSIKNDLDDALAQLTKGKHVPQPWHAAIGCYITMNASK